MMFLLSPNDFRYLLCLDVFCCQLIFLLVLFFNQQIDLIVTQCFFLILFSFGNGFPPSLQALTS